MKTPLPEKMANLLLITSIILVLTFFLSEFEYINPIPYNEILFWLTFVGGSILNLYNIEKKKKKK